MAAMRRAAMEFEAANVTSDDVLDQAQFNAMICARKANPSLSKKKLCEWFQVLAVDNEELSLAEWFCFCTFDIFESVHGLGNMFETYDSDSSGFLSAGEFKHAMDQMGFRRASAQLLAKCDTDNSGYLDYRELCLGVRDHYSTPAFSSLRAAISRPEEDDTKFDKPVIITSDKKDEAASDSVRRRMSSIRSSDVVRHHIEHLLKNNAARMMQLFREMDKDASGVISEREFNGALSALGFTGSKSAVLKLFKELDTEGNHSISFAEMRDWLYASNTAAAAPTLIEEEESKRAAHGVVTPGIDASSASPRRPQTARPLWRPVGHRPVWPLDLHVQRERDRDRLRSPPREPPIPRTPRVRHKGLGYQPRQPVCELRDVPQLRVHARQTKHQPDTLPELYISRKLNWPPRGLRLEPTIMAGNCHVLAYPRPPSRRPSTCLTPAGGSSVVSNRPVSARYPSL